MALTKMTITGYSDNKFSTQKGDAFTVMINPSKYDHSFTLNYSEEESPGKAATTTKFKTVGPEKVSFDFMLDDTGAVKKNSENEGKDIDTMLTAFKDAVYTYNGDTHEPNFVMLKWGTFIFKSRLESLKIDYQMFKPSGAPLRAKVTVSFKGYVDPEKETQIANRSSPDLTHIVTVKEGDSLPYLCNKIYKDSKYYLQVAEINNLVNIRNLKVGSKLIFPPVN